MDKTKTSGLNVAWERIGVLLTVATLALVAVACSFNARVGTLRPNVIPARTHSGTVVIAVEGAPDQKWCTASSGNMRRFCIENGGVRNRIGLDGLLRSHGFTPVSEGVADHTATLRFRRFTNALDGSEAQAVMTVEWQFELKDRSGASIVALAERTTSPQPATGRGDVGASARSMFEAVLERISSELSTGGQPDP